MAAKKDEARETGEIHDLNKSSHIMLFYIP